MQTVSTGASPIAPPKKLPWYRKLGMQVLVALILGIIVGFVFPNSPRSSNCWAMCSWR